MSASNDTLITLVGGLTIPVAALRLAWTLEGRGCSISVTDDGHLQVGPRDCLTDEDRALLREYRDVICQLVQYELPAGVHQ